MPTFVPRQRKHKVRLRRTHNVAELEKGLDSNLVEITPSTKNEKEERRQSMRSELRAQQTAISSKKQKRLDKYIVLLCLESIKLPRGKLIKIFRTKN